MAYWNYAPYVSVGERRAKAERKIKQLKKKNPNIKPIVISGNTLAKTWWGKSWNKNLERYADYSNRIGRGRSYVRHGSVLDLQIKPGKIEALVQGTRSAPYQVDIHIKAIKKTNWVKIKKACEGKLESLQELLTGKFPEGLADIFMAQGEGLFPTPQEIEFNCSCPDWAYMCKHVAAALYGIGARLDENPTLFFELRNAEIGDLVTQAVEDKTKKLLDKAKRKSSRVMEDADLGDVFGIVMEEEINYKKTKKATVKKSTKRQQTKSTGNVKKTQTKKPKQNRIVPKTDLTKTVKKQHVPKRKLTELEITNLKLENATKELEKTKKELKFTKPSKKTLQKSIDLVADIIINSKKGIGIAELNKKTGIEKNKLYSFAHRLKKQGKIRNKACGIYEKNM